jgi:hypothetical protein
VVGAFMALSGVIALVVGSVKTNGRWTVPQSLRE